MTIKQTAKLELEPTKHPWVVQVKGQGWEEYVVTRKIARELCCKLRESGERVRIRRVWVEK